ncbi:restriction endonuclease subunit S [Alteromonas portus]|uniref:Restriction endonuclease subunit S n=1 Tax=Alteromonas portus TaxID=2565549 RepID=A0A4U0Z9X2_9ALTE|nr:restriction endonuclease subunit S [Alteromonas portus]TKB02559.1 restriction endonuclease subunit S [Alteromonas portus]
MSKVRFQDIVKQKDGFLRGPFGGDLKKDIFVEKSCDTYKVYEQGVVLNNDESIGRYYISNDYFKKKMYRFEVKPKDFLVSCSGVNYGAIHQLSENIEKGVINQALLRIRLDSEKVDDNYFYYLFKALIVNMIVGKKGDSTIPNFPPLSVIKALEFELPEKDYQIQIGRLLSHLDKKIELNNRINAELETMAKTLYDYWFVQFDFPDDSPQGQGKPYKTAGGKMVYNPTLKREIPLGWEVDTLASLIKSDKTGDWGKEEPEGNYTLQVDCIRGADINGLNGNGKINAPNRYILQKNDHKLLAPFDYVIEISGGSPTQSTGRIAYITDDVLDRFTHPLICSNFCKAISLRNKDLFYCFAYLWNDLYDNGVLFGWEGKTSGIKNLLFDSFVTKHQVPIPPLGLAKQFFDFVASLEQQKQTLLKENVRLESLRDWLLPMLMNGQVTVGEAS